MRNFLAAVLSVIAVGVMLIAYGLLSPRASASDLYPSARPMLASERLVGIEDLTPRQARRIASGDVRAVPVAYETYRTPARASAVRTTRRAPGSRRAPIGP
jgi:hypothetical protein